MATNYNEHVVWKTIIKSYKLLYNLEGLHDSTTRNREACEPFTEARKEDLRVSTMDQQTYCSPRGRIYKVCPTTSTCQSGTDLLSTVDELERGKRLSLTCNLKAIQWNLQKRDSFSTMDTFLGTKLMIVVFFSLRKRITCSLH